MNHRTFVTVALGLLACASAASAGNIYEVTSQAGDKTTTYQVQFGGGRMFDQFTAFDPESKRFVYLKWERRGPAPEPAMKIWDHRTGEMTSLYTFPDVKNPLPVIPSIKEMKVCPMTGDKEFQSKLRIIVD